MAILGREGGRERELVVRIIGVDSCCTHVDGENENH